MSIDIRWSTDLVTFFDPAYWDLPADLSYDAWEAAVTADPRRYFDRMLTEAAEVGLSGVELAPAPGGWVNALRAYGSPAGFKKALSDRGLELSSSYVLPVLLNAVLTAPDAEARREAEAALEADTARHAQFLAEVGCPTLVTSTVPRAAFSAEPGVPAPAESFDGPVSDALMDDVAEQLNRIGKVAAGAGLHVAIHTDAYSLASRTVDVEALMARTDPATVQLCIDAGHIAIDGGDPVEVARRHAGRAPVLHWKDCHCHLPPHTLSGSPMERHDVMVKNFRVLGDTDGIVDWAQWTRTLREAAWRGWGVAEVDMSSDPKREIRQGIDYYTNTLASI